MTPARWPHAHLEHGIRASTPDCWLQVVGRASSVLVDLRGSRQGPPQPFSPARRTANSPSPRFAVAVGVTAVGHAGAARMCRSCRSSACHLYLEVCVCVGPGVKGLSLCWYVNMTCLTAGPPPCRMLVLTARSPPHDLSPSCSDDSVCASLQASGPFVVASLIVATSRLCHAVLTCVCTWPPSWRA